MADRMFSRMMSIRVPIFPGSENYQFNMVAAGIPVMTVTGNVRDDLYFAFVNETGFDCRLQGFAKGKAFEPVGRNWKSWSILARSDKGPFLSKKPVLVSATAFSTPYNPIPSDTVWFDEHGVPLHYLELPYGVMR